MQVSTVIQRWCSERNATSKAWLWFGALALAFCAGVAWISSNGSFFGVALIVAAAIAWTRYAPKVEQVSKLRSVHRHFYVPDALLAKLADDEAISPELKRAVADCLAEAGVITFEKLFDLEEMETRHLLDDQDRARRLRGEGFQKMAAYSKSEIR